MAADKILIIVRHGKSTWDYPGIADFDRPLKDRGIKDAYDMALRLKKHEILPDGIISSPAIRALHTAVIFSKVLEFPAENININQDLYLAEVDGIMSVVNGTDNSKDSLMIFGHNPGFTELVNYLSNLNLDNLPTSGIAILQFKTDNWAAIGKKCLSGEIFDSPHNV